MTLEENMKSLWNKYLETKDIKYLAEACEKAPFFGQKDMAKEISKILRSKKSDWYQINFEFLVFKMYSQNVV